MGIVRDLYYARKMSAGLKLPAPTVALLIKRMMLASTMNTDTEKTVSGTLVHITDALARAALSVLVNITPIQPGSGDPSPDNVRPISGLTGLSVYRTGKNLLNIDREIGTPSPADLLASPRVMSTEYAYQGIRRDNYYYPNYITGYSNQNGVIKLTTNNNINYGVGFPVECESSTKYTLSATKTNANFSVGCYDENWNFLSSLVSSTTDASVTFTTPSTAKYVTIIFGSTPLGTEGTITDIQLELGETATTYEPYNGNTYSVDWSTQAGTVYGGTLDVVTGQLTVDRVKKSASEATNWKNHTALNDGSGYYIYSPGFFPANGTKISNSHKQSFAWSWENMTFGEFIGTTAAIVTVPPEANTLALAKTYLESIGTYFVYPLATPVTYQLTPQEVQMLLGENYLWSSSGDSLSVTYVAEGNANNRQALNILLGDRYSNPGTPDDVSDKEALDIILGR